MKLTPKLRFVERTDGFEQYDMKVTERHGTEVCYRPKKIRILQQWWADFVGPLELDGEWRDVPIEQEESNETA